MLTPEWKLKELREELSGRTETPVGVIEDLPYDRFVFITFLRGRTRFSPQLDLKLLTLSSTRIVADVLKDWDQ